MEDTQLKKRQDESNKHVAFVDDEIECCGNLCGHAKFKISAKGCNQFTRMCPLCATKLNAELSGSSLFSKDALPKEVTPSKGAPGIIQGDNIKRTPGSTVLNELPAKTTQYSSSSSPYATLSNMSLPAPPPTSELLGAASKGSPFSSTDASSTTPARAEPVVVKSRDVPATPIVRKPTQEEVLRHKRLQGALRVLLSLPHGDFTTIRINGVDHNFFNDESFHNGVSPMKSTHHFRVQGRTSEKLYWFEQFAAITTPRNIYVEFCAFTNGDVCVGVWETRCNKPFHALLVYRVKEKRCELITAHQFRALFSGVILDPGKEFDMDLAVKAKTNWLIVNRRIYDEQRGLHENCRHPEVPDPHSEDEASDPNESSGDASSSDSDNEVDSDAEKGGNQEGGDGTKDDDEDRAMEVSPSANSGKGKRKSTRLPQRKSLPARKKTRVNRYSPEKGKKDRPGIPPRSRRPKPPPSPIELEEEDDKKIPTKEQKGKRKGVPPKVETVSKVETTVSTGVEALLQKMLQQQAELIQLMHDKDKADHEEVDVEDNNACALLQQITAKKPPRVPSKSPRGDQNQRYVNIAPNTFVGDRHMELFLRNNVQMARLIEENAQLRRDRLIQDLIKGAADYHHV